MVCVAIDNSFQTANQVLAIGHVVILKRRQNLVKCFVICSHLS